MVQDALGQSLTRHHMCVIKCVSGACPKLSEDHTRNVNNASETSHLEQQQHQQHENIQKDERVVAKEHIFIDLY